MVFDSVCNTRLSLSLGSNDQTNENDQKNKFLVKSADDDHDHLFPSLMLGLSFTDQITSVKVPNVKGGSGDSSNNNNNINNMHGGQQASSVSAVSSFSNSSVKREREVSFEEVEVEKAVSVSPKQVAEDQDEEGPRKKLRLTKEQSLILEDSFKDHSTLNPKQKQALAKRLNLRPRQVEVWFQNRRARTKLKQTEVDYEILKKCCETLKEENKRLYKELQELKGMKLAGSLYMHLPAATLSMCPSCERIAGGGGGGGGSGGGTTGGENSSKISLSIGAKPHHFYCPFANPSAAC